jgi:hypothetical protein
LHDLSTRYRPVNVQDIDWRKVFGRAIRIG